MVGVPVIGMAIAVLRCVPRPGPYCAESAPHTRRRQPPGVGLLNQRPRGRGEVGAGGRDDVEAERLVKGRHGLDLGARVVDAAVVALRAANPAAALAGGHRRVVEQSAVGVRGDPAVGSRRRATGDFPAVEGVCDGRAARDFDVG